MVGVTKDRVQEELDEASELLLSKALVRTHNSDRLEKLLFQARCVLEMIDIAKVSQRLDMLLEKLVDALFDFSVIRAPDRSQLFD